MTKIKPALTAEEWATVPDCGNAPKRDLPLYFPGQHGIAAINLHGKPYGFTRADVEILRVDAKDAATVLSYVHADDVDTWAERLIWLRSLVNRIEALLPPEKGSATDGRTRE